MEAVGLGDAAKYSCMHVLGKSQNTSGASNASLLQRLRRKTKQRAQVGEKI